MLRNLLISLLSLYTVGANADMYECKPSMEKFIHWYNDVNRSSYS